MLDMFILNISPNVSFITFKSSSIGLVSPNSSPYDNQDKKLTCEAKLPNRPPTTIPDKINNSRIHIFFSLVAILKITSLSLV